jgi:hypothetical protein
MTLFLQNDAGGSGTGGVFPDRGFGHLVQIANMDTGIGQDAAVGDLIHITYTETLSGIPPDRLDDLVNTDFAGVPGTTDIIVIPVDETFVRPNGHHVTENAGLTFALGHPENPTASVLVVYDTSDNNGAGYCLPAEGGGTVGFPGSVILYHELSHALRRATTSTLDTSATGCAASDEEHQAEEDENDMRDQLGVGHRDTTQHCATTGCASNCCVVASVATGSPYGADVSELRRVRDESLRGSEVGFDFFERLHYDYYGFSPQVVRMMERAPELRGRVSDAFVVPLTRCLQLLRFYTEQRPDARALGERFQAGLGASPELVALSAREVTVALALLRGADGHAAGLPAELAPLAELLRDRASRSAYVRWALLDTIEIYLEGVGRRLDGDPPAQLGHWLARRFDDWGAELPLTDVWQRLSEYAIGEELAFLRVRLLPAPRARARFARRLKAHLADRPGIDALLERERYDVERSVV